MFIYIICAVSIRNSSRRVLVKKNKLFSADADRHVQCDYYCADIHSVHRLYFLWPAEYHHSSWVVILGAVIGAARNRFGVGLGCDVPVVRLPQRNGGCDYFPQSAYFGGSPCFGGATSGWYYRGRRLLRRSKYGEVTAAGITGVLGTFTNTVLVLSAISLFGGAVTTLGATLPLSFRRPSPLTEWWRSRWR